MQNRNPSFLQASREAAKECSPRRKPWVEIVDNEKAP
jgi:hypothetical protein